MAEIVVFESVSLDGVMQAPGAPDEDDRGGFRHGGWAVPYADEAMADLAGRESALLFGRRTYEQFYSFWPHQADNPYTDILNRSRKYVASRTLREPLPWQNSTLLGSPVEESVSEIKATEGLDIVVLGSGELLRSLMEHRLVDTFVLLIHPLVLGSGRRLFPDDHHARLDLVECVPTGTGVLVATYRPGGEER